MRRLSGFTNGRRFLLQPYEPVLHPPYEQHEDDPDYGDDPVVDACRVLDRCLELVCEHSGGECAGEHSRQRTEEIMCELDTNGAGRHADDGERRDGCDAHCEDSGKSFVTHDLARPIQLVTGNAAHRVARARTPCRIGGESRACDACHADREPHPRPECDHCKERDQRSWDHDESGRGVDSNDCHRGPLVAAEGASPVQDLVGCRNLRKRCIPPREEKREEYGGNGDQHGPMRAARHSRLAFDWHFRSLQGNSHAVVHNGASTRSLAMAEEKPAGAARRAAPGVDAQQQIRVSASNLKSTYCNMCNANSTREEVVLNFGVNQTWDRGPNESEVSLEHRIILSPFAAKRLSQMLGKLIAEYETRYGELK